ncbi:MAG TPA: energy transducer TonB [Blastocatellia bacterium]|nr:energy transducer TonB [Blastocatellia bacterium]
MFDKMVISGSSRKNSRLSKFFLGSAFLYLSALGIALILTIVLANPQLLSATSGLNVRLIAADPQPQVLPQVQSGSHSHSQPPMDFRNPVTFDAVGRGQNTAALFRPAPPSIDNRIGRDDGIGPDTIGTVGAPGLTVRTGAAPAPRPKPDPTPTPAKPTLVNVSKGVLQGKAITRVVPPYPQLAKLTHRFGNVDVEVIVSPEGKVESARVISGDPVFRSAAIQAALAWRFSPTRLGDTPVRVTGVITFVFKLDE